MDSKWAFHDSVATCNLWQLKCESIVFLHVVFLHVLFIIPMISCQKIVLNFLNLKNWC